MKFRSILLIALMVSVPSLALFSHHLPAGLSAAAARLLCAPVGWVASWRESTGPGPTIRMAGVERVVQVDPEPTTQPAIAATDRAGVRERLRDSGVVAVECRPLPGAGTGHVATGRVPLDAEGQLQRVFQVTGHDSLAAERRLLEEVTAWQQRRTLPR